MRKLIVNNRSASGVRIVTSSGTPAEKYAASELEKYLGRAGISVTSDGAVISLAIDSHIGRDGYSIEASDGQITITGGNGRGVIYGVYALLEKYAGMRFFMPGLETCGEGDIIIDEGCEFVPVFEFRQSDWPCGNDDADWCVKNGINQRDIPEEMGGNMKYGLFVHSMNRLVGTPHNEQPCLSDPEVLKKAIASVREILSSHPEVRIISVSQNDNQNYCKCEKCAAVDAEEGSHMGSLLRFVNAVAADIADDYPNVIVDTLAYQYTRNIPSITRPLDNVCIRLCSIECCFSQPLSDKTCGVNAKFISDIEDWNTICDRIYIWDYVTDFSYYIPPFPNFGVLRDNMRFFADHGVRGMYPEGNYNSPRSGEFGELRCYLLAKLMMNPYMSAVEYYRHMDEFLTAYYGGGWHYVRAFIDWTCAEAACGNMNIWSKPFKIISREKYEAMEETIDMWWDKAEAMAGDRIEYVRRSRFQWRYIKLMLHPDADEGRRFRADVESADVLWNEWRKLSDDVDYSLPPDEWK